MRSKSNKVMKRIVFTLLIVVFCFVIVQMLFRSASFEGDRESREESGFLNQKTTIMDSDVSLVGGSAGSVQGLPVSSKVEVLLPEVVAVGDLEIPLIFPNGVADLLKQFILADFKVIFEFSEDYEVYELNRGLEANERDVNVNGVDYMVKRRLSFRSSRPPSLLHKKLGDLVDQNGVDKLVVPEIVVDEYKEAFELVSIYSDEFKALGDFVKLVTDSSGESPFLLHPKDVFYMPGSPILMRLEEDPSLVGEAQRYYSEATRVRMPSVLEFEEIPQDQQKHGIYLKAKGWALDGEPPTPSVEVGFVFHDGRWKIMGR